MTRIEIDNSLCDRLEDCPAREACSFDAIVPVEGGEYPGANGYRLIEKNCAGCGICAVKCPTGAVRIVQGLGT